MQKRILLRSFESSWTGVGWLAGLGFSLSTGVSETPTDATDHHKHEEDENNHVEDRPVAVCLGDAPIEENVWHPKGIADTCSALRVTRSMTRTIILANDSSDLTYWWTQDAVILPELVFEDSLNIETGHDGLVWAISRCSRRIKHENHMVRLVINSHMTNVEFDIVAKQKKQLLFQLIKLKEKFEVQISWRTSYDLRTSCWLKEEAWAVRTTSTKLIISGSSKMLMTAVSVPVNPCSSDTVSLYL